MKPVSSNYSRTRAAGTYRHFYMKTEVKKGQKTPTLYVPGIRNKVIVQIQMEHADDDVYVDEMSMLFS